jgi:hypothetical protein
VQALGLPIWRGVCWIDTMARGWESKSVEAQQEEASRRSSKRPSLSAEQRAAEDRRRTLALSRARAEADLDRATAPQHRHLLEQTIAALDQQLAELKN